MKSVVCLIDFSQDEIDTLLWKCEGLYELCFPDCSDKAAYAEALRGANVIIGDPLPQELTVCEKLEWMQTTWAGVDDYVKSGCFPKGAVLCNMSGAYGVIIAEHAIGMLLSLCHRMPEYLDNQKKGIWQMVGYDKPLEGSNVLILGTGNLGSELAKRLKAFSLTITGVNRTGKCGSTVFDRIISFDNLDSVLPDSDFVISCVPATPLTDGLFSKSRLLSMKYDAVFINVGRGNVVSLDSLSEVLDAGHLWGAAIDVASMEPIPNEHRIWKARNIIITPHVSGSAFSPDSPTAKRLRKIAISNFSRYIDGLPYSNIVNFKAGY